MSKSRKSKPASANIPISPVTEPAVPIAVFPDLITEVEVTDCSDEMPDNGRDTKTLNEELGKTFGMNYEKLSVYLAAALQEASKKIDALEARITALES